jgi:hypothetical protein
MLGPIGVTVMRQLRCEALWPAFAGPSETSRPGPRRAGRSAVGGREAMRGETSQSDAGPVPGGRRPRSLKLGIPQDGNTLTVAAPGGRFLAPISCVRHLRYLEPL